MGQLPGAVHPARRRRRCTRAQGRPVAPADAARLGWLVRDQVIRVRVRRLDGARRPPPRRPRGLDRGQARAPRGECRSNRPHDGGGGRVLRRRAAARAPLRRDRGRRRVRPGTRAGDPLPHARFALGRVHRAERRRPEPRRAHEHDPLGSQPWLRRPAALSRAGADDGDRRPTPRPRSRRARAAQPDPGRCNAVPHALGRALRLRRLRGLPRQGARAGRLRRARRTGRRTPSRWWPRRDRARVHRRALDLEHGVHHARADRRRARADAAQVRQRRGSLDRDRSARRDHRQAGFDTAGPGPPHGLRPGRRRRARLHSRRRHRDVRDGHGERALDGRLRQLLLALLRRRRRCRPGGGTQAPCQDRRDPRARR